MATFEANLREWRRRRGLTQAELGKLAGIGRDSISHMETGNRFPKPENVRALASALEIETNDLFDGPRTTSPKGEALPLPRDGAERGWMGKALARTITAWSSTVENGSNPHHSRTIAVAALDVIDAVTLAYGLEWQVLPEGEKTERRQVAEMLLDLADRAYAQYRASEQAEADEMAEVEARRNEMRKLTREIA